jgi:phosphoribosylpyrophosphate synthetase
MAVKFDGKKTGLFAAGVLFGTAGIKLLSSKDAKKVYTGCTAAVLRMKDCIMKIAANVQDNCEDIYAGAVQINDDRKAQGYTFIPISEMIIRDNFHMDGTGRQIAD